MKRTGNLKVPMLKSITFQNYSIDKKFTLKQNVQHNKMY